MGYTPHVLVVGGGVTGTGVARDLAARGLEVTLVERGPLTAGATGRMHGLLHSGARYAETDPASATDCRAENAVLREIASHCVEDVGGLFVEHPADPDGYFERKREACERAEIPAETIDGDEARAREPGLSEDIERALAVPDAAVDPFRLTAATARAAEQEGAAVLTHAEVVDLQQQRGAVAGARIRENDPTAATEAGEVIDIDADYVVNAAGAWAGRIAAMADLEVTVRASKGAMVVAADRHVETVVNRCRPRGQGDILVPHGDVSILGTTDVDVEDPDDYAEEGWEVDLLFEELEPVVPSLRDARTLRSYWGVRPLYEPPGADGADTTALTREFVLLDHEDRDDTFGMVTVVGGKLTTHRLMAEEIADHVCATFGIDRPCRTAEVPLPGSETTPSPEDTTTAFDVEATTWEATTERIGARAEAVLDESGSNPLVCPCRRVTAAEVQAALTDLSTVETDLNAVRIRTGVGTGDCQGRRCCHRAAAELHPEADHEQVTRSLDAFYQERWDGQRHALWGEQLQRAMDSYALHATTFNRDRAPERPDLAAFDDGPALDDPERPPEPLDDATTVRDRSAEAAERREAEE